MVRERDEDGETFAGLRNLLTAMDVVYALYDIDGYDLEEAERAKDWSED